MIKYSAAGRCSQGGQDSKMQGTARNECMSSVLCTVNLCRDEGGLACKGFGKCFVCCKSPEDLGRVHLACVYARLVNVASGISKLASGTIVEPFRGGCAARLLAARSSSTVCFVGWMLRDVTSILLPLSQVKGGHILYFMPLNETSAQQ